MVGAMGTIVSWAMALCAAQPANPDPLAPLLRAEIIGQTLPLAEVQRYCDPRVPRMAKFATTSAWEAEARRLRQDMFDRVVFRGAASQWRKCPLRVEWLDTVPGGPGYRIKKLKYQALPGMWIPAVLYEPETLDGKMPVSMAVNGHVGPPGKSVDYKQLRCINQAKRGMIVLNVEWIGMGQLNAPGFAHTKMNQLDLCGTSGLAPFYLSLEHGLDLLLSLPHADPARVAVQGLSGGGWQTIVISGLDPRVTLANPVAGYSSFVTRLYHMKDLGDSEQTPCDMGTVLDYTHLTAMRAPRPTLLTYNSQDNCCFESGYALQPLIDAARPVFALYGRESALRTHVNDNPGTHNYELDNRLAFYRMLGEFFFAAADKSDAREIPSAAEVRKKEELLIPLEHNADFNTLARALAQNLPHDADLPADAAARPAWREARRQKLRELVKFKTYRAQGVESQRKSQDGVTAIAWRFALGDWTVPGVELTAGVSKQTVLLVADAGRASALKDLKHLLAAGNRVVAIDPFDLGESALPHAPLYPLQIAALGDRPLGIQAGQIAAVARWLAEKYAVPVQLISIGPRTQLQTLVAAALEPTAIGNVENRDGLASLKQLIEKDWPVNKGPEMFCFGLLESFDLQQLAALIAPRVVSP